MRAPLWIVVAFVLAASLSCTGTTGFDLVTFGAEASGASDAVAGQPYAFDVGSAHVVLTRALLHVGALYFTQSVPTSGGGPAPCTLPGTYSGAFVGEVRGGATVDLLNPSAQPLAVTGDGSTIPAVSAQVWLTYGNVNASNDSSESQPILTLEGSVASNGPTQSFSALLWIDPSRQPTPPPNSLPGEDPICLLRIVSGISVNITFAQGGTLLLRVDPKALFNNVDFAQLPTTGCDPSMPADLCFTNDESNQPSTNLFQNLVAAGPVYAFEWQPPVR